jgi:thymidylate synthase
MSVNLVDLLYRRMARDILRYPSVPTRATLMSTGKKVSARSVVGENFYSSHCYFPILTGKFVDFDRVAREILWMISGSTSVHDLQRHDVHIWDQWAGTDGDLGPVYGAQWRRREGPDGTMVDQLAAVIEGIRAVKKDPTASVGRRLIVDCWDVANLHRMALPPCHMMYQFFVRDDELQMVVYQRSGDMFLGVPWNLAGYGLLHRVVAHVTGLKATLHVHNFGDLHLYENHEEPMREYLRQPTFDESTLEIAPEVKEIDDLTFERIQLVGYKHGPRIKAEVAVLCREAWTRRRLSRTCRPRRGSCSTPTSLP